MIPILMLLVFANSSFNYSMPNLSVVPQCWSCGRHLGESNSLFPSPVVTPIKLADNSTVTTNTVIDHSGLPFPIGGGGGGCLNPSSDNSITLSFLVNPSFLTVIVIGFIYFLYIIDKLETEQHKKEMEELANRIVKKLKQRKGK